MLPVEVGEETELWDDIVHCVRFVVVQVAERSAGLVAKEQLHPGITIIDAIQLFASQEALDILLNLNELLHRTNLRPCRVHISTVSKSEHILIFSVLESVLIH